MHGQQRTNLKLALAWRLKQALRTMLDSGTDLTQAAALLDTWLSWARRCSLTPFKRLAATL